MNFVLSVLTIAVILGVGLTAQPWWKTATFYQIYPRSFMDYDNDGIGDLKGMLSKVNYLAELGVTAVWMNPIYPSPLADFGYDVSNYTAIDSTFGTMNDFKNLLTAFHAKDIKVVMDFVPNHSSDEHPWFNKSIYMEGNYTSYYVWRDAKIVNGTRTVPNNWQAAFSASGWTWNEHRQQYYLHQFMVKQPDLNFRDENVKREMKGIMKFWLDLGIDGLRADAVKYLLEDAQFRDNPSPNLNDSTLASTNTTLISYTQNLNETYELLNEWSEFVKEYAASNGKELVFLLEIYDTLKVVNSYSGGMDYPFTIPFNFFLVFQITLGCTATSVLESVNEWINAMPDGSTPNWQVGNHDRVRVSTRAGTDLVDSVNMILAMLPGIMNTYYGEELGMEGTYLTYEQTVDTVGKAEGKDGYQRASRDPERTPLQWDDTTNAGFCVNSTPWLPVNPDYWSVNIAAQKAASKSHLKVYQSLMALRKSDTFMSNTTNYKMLAPDDDTFAVLRWADTGKRYLLIVNFGSSIITPLSNNTFLSNFNLQNITQFTIHTAGINAGYSKGETITKSKGIGIRPKAGVILQFTTTALSSASSLLVSLTLLCVSFNLFFLL